MTAEPPLGEWLLGQPLVLLALAGLLVAGIGWRLEAAQSRLGHHLRTLGYAAMALAAGLIVIDSARRTRNSDFALELGSRTEARIEGRDTVIPLGDDGHFRVLVTINGQELPVLIDTGATYTSMEEAAAKRLEISDNPNRMPVQLGTANGTIVARFGVADELRLGAISARNVDIAITPNTDSPAAVVGMDLLSRLEGWRVENGQLILSPPRE